MTRDELAGYIDLSLLRPQTPLAELKKSILKSLCYPFASIVVPPCHVRRAVEWAEGSSVKIGTVVGFPLGYQDASIKRFESQKAVEEGAEEVDMVMNLSLFRSGDAEALLRECRGVVDTVPTAVVKVIIECCYLTDEEKVAACNIVIRSGAGFVKTSTGFGPGGATVADVKLLSDTAAGRIEVKASGGINDLETTLKLIEAGASRIGASSGIEIVEALKSDKQT